VQAKQFFFAEMMCKQLIFCVKAATRLGFDLLADNIIILYCYIGTQLNNSLWSKIKTGWVECRHLRYRHEGMMILEKVGGGV
jgi:hypothetical protein